MAVPVSAEEELVIKKRLLTQTTVARVNADPPLKKLSKRFLALCAAADSGLSEESSALHALFLRELELYEFQLSRIATVSSANEREQESYAQLLAQLEASMGQALSDIESLKVELEGARLDRKHKEEYEMLRKQCLAFPSRADTQAAIAGVEQDVAALEQESAATAATVELRRQQFRDLIESVDKLARALEEDGPVQPLPSAAVPMHVDSA